MKKNLTALYIYRISTRFYFHLAVLFVYFYINNISILYIELLLAAYGVMLTISSNFKNKLILFLTEKQIILLGELIKIAGLVCLIFNTNMWVLLMGQLLSGVGYSFTAGTDSSLLREIVSDEKIYKKFETSSNSWMFISFLIAGVTGSILFSINQYYVFLFSIIANIISILSILIIKVPVKSNRDFSNELNIDNIEETIKSAEKYAEQNFWKNYYALSRAFPLAIFVGFLPYFLFVKIEISLYFFGLVLSVFNIAGFIAAKTLFKLSLRFNYKILTFGTMSLTAISMLLLGIVGNAYISVLVVFLLGLSSGGIRPMTVLQLNIDQLGTTERMSIVSSMEKRYGFWNSLILISGGLLFSILGFRLLMIILAFSYVMLLIISSQKSRFTLSSEKKIY